MIVYVESNFIIEIALQQEETADAEGLLGLAQAGRVDLCLPSFALAEPFTTLGRRALQRKDLAKAVAGELAQLRRSTPHSRDLRKLQHVPATLAAIEGAQADRLDQTLLTVLRVGRLVPIDVALFQSALDHRRRYGFSSTQDAIIYASVLADLRAQPPATEKCFVTRNPRDFERNPIIRHELQSLNCTLVGRFSAGFSFVRSRLGISP